MSTTENRSDGVTNAESAGPAGPGGGGRWSVAALGGVLVALLLAAAILAVGLPTGSTVWDTELSTLTVAMALVVALGGISLVGALSYQGQWRVVDSVVASVLGVVGGFYLWGVAVAWEPLTLALKLAPPSAALLAGLWVVPAVLGGLVIRKPGAAVYVELVGAVLEALLGNQWGFATIYYGLIEGLGAEFVLALLFYRSFAVLPALVSGAGAGAAVGLLDTTIYYPELLLATKVGYLGFAVLSGTLIAGGGAWLLTRALARAGALSAVASGRSVARV